MGRRKYNCPERKWFARLIDGRVTSKQEETLVRHLDYCETCQNTVDQLSDFDSLASSIDESSIGSSREQSSSLMEARLSKIRAKRSCKSDFKPGYTDILPWLEACDGAIGRINEFELTQFIGRGGMGLVFEARDRKLQRPVAVKLMAPGLLADSAAPDRFLREARSAAGINHSNVVTVHSVDQVRGLPFLVMELIRGWSLEQQLRKSDQLSIVEILKIANQAGLGLAAAHRSGVTHRDIKPSNLMFDSHSKRIKIADFGLASSVNDTGLTRTGMMVGTPDFASPEQVNGESVDARSDLFSLGCVLYLLCTGNFPFQSNSAIQTLDAVRASHPARADLVNSDVPKELADIIEKLMQKNPAARFQSAAELSVVIKSVPFDDMAESVTSNIANLRPFGKHRSSWNLALGVGVCVVVSILVLMLIGNPFGLFVEANSKKNLPASEVTDLKSPEKQESSAKAVAEDKSETVRKIKSNDELVVAIEEPGDLVLHLIPGRVYSIPEAIEISDRSIQFIGDAANRPILELRSFADQSSFSVEDGTLTFRGIKIRDRAQGESESPLIYVGSASLVIEEVLLNVGDREHGILLDDSDLVATSSILLAENSLFHVTTHSRQTIEFNNSFVSSLSVLAISDVVDLKMIADQTHFVSWCMMEILTEDLDDLDNLSIRASAINSTFLNPDAVFVMQTDSEEDAFSLSKEFTQRIEWESDTCELPESSFMIVHDEEERSFTWSDVGISVGDKDRFIDERVVSRMEQTMDQIHTERNSSIERLRTLLTE